MADGKKSKVALIVAGLGSIAAILTGVNQLIGHIKTEEPQGVEEPYTDREDEGGDFITDADLARQQQLVELKEQQRQIEEALAELRAEKQNRNQPPSRRVVQTQNRSPHQNVRATPTPQPETDALDLIEEELEALEEQAASGQQTDFNRVSNVVRQDALSQYLAFIEQQNIAAQQYTQAQLVAMYQNYLQQMYQQGAMSIYNPQVQALYSQYVMQMLGM